MGAAPPLQHARGTTIFGDSLSFPGPSLFVPPFHLLSAYSPRTVSRVDWAEGSSTGHAALWPHEQTPETYNTAPGNGCEISQLSGSGTCTRDRHDNTVAIFFAREDDGRIAHY
jgi:hypothetical protein